MHRSYVLFKYYKRGFHVFGLIVVENLQSVAA
jgi:hypothetical protein